MDLKFEEVFKMPLLCLKLCRAEPDVPNGLKWLLWFTVVHGIYILYFIGLMNNIINFNLKDNDFVQTCKNGTLCVAISSATFQIAIILWKKNVLINLFENIRIDYVKVRTQTTDEQEIVLKYAKQSIRVGKMWVSVGVGATLIFPFKNMIMHIYYYCISDFRWIHLYHMIYPKIIEDRKHHMVLFSALYVIMVLYTCYGACLYIAFSPLGPSFMLHACGQLEILTKRIEKLFSTNLSEQDIMNELRIVAMELQRIYNFVNDIQEAFRIVYEVILKVTSIVLPLTVYSTIKAFAVGDFTIEFVVFMIGSVIISASPCYYSELLKEKGEMFRFAIYSCGWERTWNRRSRTMILLLLQRASRPIAITTIFKTLCLDALTDVYRQSYALFNLMNAMWN